MIQVTSKSGTKNYSKAEWNLAWFLVWLSGVVFGALIF